MRPLLAALLLGSVCACAHGSILLVDSVQGSYLRPGAAADLADGGAAALAAALTGLVPSRPISEQESKQVEGILKPVLQHPRAHIQFNVAGLTQGDVAALFGNRQQRQVNVGKETVATVMTAFEELEAANPSANLVCLDEQVEACKSNCVNEFLGQAMVRSAGHAKEHQLIFKSGAALDLVRNPASKFFAAELSALQAGLQSQLDAVTGRMGAVLKEDVLVAEATLLSLSSLTRAFGADSAEAKEAKEAVVALIQWAVDQLDAAFGGDVTYQVSLTKGTPAASEPEELMAWKHNARRLQATAWPGADDAKLAKSFTTKACAYGGFVLLVYFSLAGIWCMCNMPMQADTLLFGAGKKDS